MSVQNIESLTNDQLKALLFGPNLNENFFQATANYMAKLSETQSKQVQDSSENLTLATNAQSALVDLTKQQTIQMDQAYQEEAEMQPSSMPGWLGDILCVFMFLVSCVTLDPVMIGISGFGMIMQTSGAEQKMADAVSGGDPNKAAAFEFGFSLGLALAGGIGSAAKGLSTEVAEEAEEVAEQAAQQASGYASKTFGGRFLSLDSLKNIFSYLGQNLMLSNFWTDFAKGPLKMSDTDAMIFGMVAGMAFTLGTSFLSEQNGLSQLMKSKATDYFASKGYDFEKFVRMFSYTMNLGASGTEIASSALNIQIGEQYKKLSDFTKDILAPAESRLTLLQGLLNGWNSVISASQDNLSTLTNFATTENQTFSSLATMFREA